MKRKILAAALIAGLMLQMASCDNDAPDYMKTVNAMSGETGAETENGGINRVQESDLPQTDEADIKPSVYPMMSGPAPAKDECNKSRFPKALITEGTEINGTYIGSDGWMFYKDTIDNYTGGGIYTEVIVGTIKDKMAQRLAWLDEQGIKMYFVIAPNKNSIYPEYMPASMVMGEYRNIDQTVEILEEMGVNVIDGRAPLIAAKESDPDRLLYYKTDTHWNNYGGYVVYQALMDRICADFPNAVRRTEQDYDITYMETYMKDQAYNLGYYNQYKEIGPQYTLLDGKTASLIWKADKEKWGQFRFTYNYPDGYSDHLYNFGFENESIPDAPSVYVIRDSFGIALTGFIKDSFSVSDYNWTTRFERSVISEKKPDVLIVEVAERHLSDYFNMRAFSD